MNRYQGYFNRSLESVNRSQNYLNHSLSYVNRSLNYFNRLNGVSRHPLDFFLIPLIKKISQPAEAMLTFGVTFRTNSQISLPAEAKMPMGKHLFGFLDEETPKAARRRRSPKVFP
jgi:hypothetical protein